MIICFCYSLFSVILLLGSILRVLLDKCLVVLRVRGALVLMCCIGGEGRTDISMRYRFIFLGKKGF